MLPLQLFYRVLAGKNRYLEKLFLPGTSCN
jgi:hypothetical protein